MISVKYLLVFFLVTISLGQYSFVKNITNTSLYSITDAEVSSVGEFIYIRTSNDFYIYDSNLKIFQIGTGWPNSKISASDNAFTIGQSIWARQTYDFELLTNLSNIISTKISKSGLVVAAWNSSKAVYVFSRSSIYDNFSLYYTIQSTEAPNDVVFNNNGSLLAVSGNFKVYLYQNLSGGYRVYDMINHGFNSFTQILAPNNFSYIIVRCGAAVNFFQFLNNTYSQYKNLSFGYSISDWALDTNHLVIGLSSLQQVYVYRNIGIDFNQVQNLSSTCTAVGAGNGTLITAAGITVSIWRSAVSLTDQEATKDSQLTVES
jgi:hypothetical protein